VNNPITGVEMASDVLPLDEDSNATFSLGDVGPITHMGAAVFFKSQTSGNGGVSFLHTNNVIVLQKRRQESVLEIGTRSIDSQQSLTIPSSN
jgi:hypothetical protein